MKHSTPAYLLVLAALASCTNTKNEEAVLKQSYVHKYGIAMDENEWTERGQSGQIVSVLGSDVIRTETKENGVLHGKTTYTFPHSRTIAKQEIYEKGNLVSTTQFDVSGHVVEESKVVGFNSAIVSRWFIDGMRMSVEKIDSGRIVEAQYYSPSNVEEGKILRGQGTRVSRNSEGLLLSHDAIVDGEMVESTNFYPNGDPRCTTPYVKGQIEGIRRTFLMGGMPASQEEWSQGKQDGLTLIFQNGEKIAEVPYKNGQKHGTERRYRENGEVAQELGWRRNLQNGPMHTFVDGKPSTNWYYNGNQVSEATYKESMGII